MVNSLVEKKDIGKKEPTYKLMVEQCQKCFLVQVVDPVSAKKIYTDQDYLYYSSDMPTLSEYFYDYAREVKKYLSDGDFVVEIGSNDGVLLKHFPQQRVLGIDPATNVVIRALREGVSTLSAFFTRHNAEIIERDFGQAKAIMANNCIAHIDDLTDVMKGIKVLLHPDGVLVLECNYWGGMVKNKNYALIYHDHFSYFSLENWINYLNKFDMKIFDAYVTPAQGGSLRMFIDKVTFGNTGRQETGRFKELMEDEIKSNLNSEATCKYYRESVLAEASKLHTVIQELKDAGKKIAGYGAAAKGFSVMKLAGITESHLDYLVDDSPAKQGRFTPITHIPVMARKDVENDLPDYFFITAPNYATVIMEKEKASGYKGQFILTDGTII